MKYIHHTTPGPAERKEEKEEKKNDEKSLASSRTDSCKVSAYFESKHRGVYCAVPMKIFYEI